MGHAAGPDSETTPDDRTAAPEYESACCEQLLMLTATSAGWAPAGGQSDRDSMGFQAGEEWRTTLGWTMLELSRDSRSWLRLLSVSWLCSTILTATVTPFHLPAQQTPEESTYNCPLLRRCFPAPPPHCHALQSLCNPQNPGMSGQQIQ